MSKIALISLAFVTTLGAMLTVTAASAGELSSGIVIRGIGADKTCSANTVVPILDQIDGRVNNLSINCTDATSKINDYANYTAGLSYVKFCVAEIVKIKKNAGSVKTDPFPGNQYNCLMSTIKVEVLVGLMTPKP